MKPQRILGASAIALMTVAATDSLRNLPSMAVYGWASVSWFLLGTLLFLVPIALVAAELATGWPIAGGVYAWVREAFGERWGFLAVWCEWAENVVWFPSILTFIATTLVYAISPEASTSGPLLLIVMAAVLWILTLVNLQGLRATSLLERFGVIAGTMIPQVALVVLALVWMAQGRPSEIAFSVEALKPELDLTTLPLVATVVLLFAGIELSGYHALETKDPQRDYPRAILSAAAVIFVLSVLSTLAIAIVVPLDQLNLAAGIIQAFSDFLDAFGLGVLLPVVAVLTAVGAMATLTTWMLGPAKGLGVAARRGNLPPLFSRFSENGVPASTLILQSVMGTAFCALIVLVPSINAAYWLFTALTTQILATMYILLFAAALQLRRTRPDQARPYRVPGGRWGMRLACAAGFASCTFVLVIGFFPPGNEQTAIPYPIIMAIGYGLLIVPPFIFQRFRKPSWVMPEPAEAETVPAA